MKNHKRDIEKILRQLGVNSTYKGFYYLTYGITQCLANPYLLTYICKGLYVDIAFHFNTTIECVERNIRTVKIIILERGNPGLVQKVFGDILIGRKQLTNAEFIDGIVAYLQETFSIKQIGIQCNSKFL